MGVVVDAERVGDGQEQRVGLCDRFVRLELLDEDVGFGGVAPPEDRPPVGLDEARDAEAVGT